MLRGHQQHHLTSVPSPPSMGACEESMDTNNNLQSAAGTGGARPSPGLTQQLPPQLNHHPPQVGPPQLASHSPSPGGHHSPQQQQRQHHQQQPQHQQQSLVRSSHGPHGHGFGHGHGHSQLIDTSACWKDVFLGQREFSTFDEFSQLFSKFEKRSRFLFRVKNSSSVEAENRRRKDQIDGAIKYSGLVLCCVNSELGHGKPNSRSGQCKAHIYLRYRSSTRRLAIMTSSFIHNHPQEEGASLNTRICVTERLGKQDRLAPRRKGARSSKALLSVLPHAGQFPGGGRGTFSGHGPGLSLSSHSPPETALSTPSASPPVPLDLRAGRVPGGMLGGHPFLSGLPFLLPGASHLSAQEAFLQRLIQTQGGLSGGLSGVSGIQVPTSPSPSEILAQMGTNSSPLHGSGILPPFSPDSLLGKRLSPFRPFGTHATLPPEEAVGTSRAFSPSSLPPHLQSHFSSIVQNGITPPGSVSNASSTNQVAGGLLEPECVLRTSESKRLRLSPCGSESSLTLTGSAPTAEASNGHVAGSNDLRLRLFETTSNERTADSESEGSPRSTGARDEEATMMSALGSSLAAAQGQGGSLVQDLSTKAGLRRPSGASSPIEVPASPPASAPATPRTSSSSPVVLDDAGDVSLMDQDQPVSIIVRTGASEYELPWEQLESLFKLCAKCGGRVDDSAEDAHTEGCALTRLAVTDGSSNGASSNNTNVNLSNGGNGTGKSVENSSRAPITLETLCQLAKARRKHSSENSSSDAFNSER
ncbi:uncharacterized protein LOC111254523 isoform X2 [Varroa destructor]|uniref:ZSWIM3 N-terminal domain-containing protein n=1 Tax=Varroa destructor TaxID=109461 RepID=A0A7M7KUX9_VARDE|nr:uncharacterized protein LOC111254523 isoform X2 [Varroa destructor]